MSSLPRPTPTSCLYLLQSQSCSSDRGKSPKGLLLIIRFIGVTLLDSFSGRLVMVNQGRWMFECQLFTSHSVCVVLWMPPLPHPTRDGDLQPLFSGANDSSSQLSLLTLASAAPWGCSSTDAVCGHRFTRQTASQAEPLTTRRSTCGPWDAATHSCSLKCSMATMQLILLW